MNDLIDLISDTVTRPSIGMLEYMMHAEVGDDVFGADPTINKLQKKVAKMFDKEAALFCPSGTMTNQIAIRIHTHPLDELICDELSHVYHHETGGYASNAGVAINLIKGINGKITADQIQQAVKPTYDWLPESRLVVLENSSNKGGGNYYTNQEIEPIADLCKSRGIKLHLDGARIFNVLVETNEPTSDTGRLFDTISICISKGLGAPVGSLLIGSEDDIQKARRFRKVMGGGMRQAGYLAAACLYALEHNVDRLKIDNDRAKKISHVISDLAYVEKVSPVKTNIVLFDLNSISSEVMVNYLKINNISSSAFGPRSVRLVFHMDIKEEMMDEIVRVLEQFNPK